jgi:hypothetical protein
MDSYYQQSWIVGTALIEELLQAEIGKAWVGTFNIAITYRNKPTQ